MNNLYEVYVSTEYSSSSVELMNVKYNKSFHTYIEALNYLKKVRPEIVRYIRSNEQIKDNVISIDINRYIGDECAYENLDCTVYSSYIIGRY